MGIEDSQGCWQNNPHVIDEVLLSYFQNIYTTSNPYRMDEVFQGIPKKVSKKHKKLLDKKFSEQEIKEACSR